MSNILRFRVGDIVNHHALRGAPPTSRNHVITALGSLPSGRGVAWLSDRIGCVALETLSPAVTEKIP